MSRAVVKISEMNEFLNGIMSKNRLVAPTVEEGILQFSFIEDASRVVLNDELPYKSPKEFLFPQMEKIIDFDGDGNIADGQITQPTVILGVKPCDLEALKILTAVFTQGSFVDTYFANSLNETTIIGLGCKTAKPGCFCSERLVEKGFSKDCDIFLWDDGEDYTAIAVTETGEALLEDLNLKAEDSDGRPIKEAEKTEALEILADENTLFNKVNWDLISEKCLGCGTCTFICPTCHCFEFRDVSDKRAAYRYRCWDSCMYPKFTLHASGHNPRPSKKERYRQRIMHKYLYVKQNFGYTACTGCGRCIRSCPAGMNIRTVVKKIMQEVNN